MINRLLTGALVVEFTNLGQGLAGRDNLGQQHKQHSCCIAVIKHLNVNTLYIWNQYHYYMYTRVSYRILSWGREKHGGIAG